ncbi:phosphoenolpyruvate carboxylase, partial [Isoptericola sp. NPDC060257]
MPDPLRDDIRLLGGLLGTVLKEAGGQSLLDDVERLRGLTIRAYGADDGGATLAEAAEVVAGFTPERAEQVARAFTCYFHLANLAEEYHRVRVLRARESDAASGVVIEDSLPQAFTQLAEEVGRDEALRRLGEIEF